MAGARKFADLDAIVNRVRAVAASAVGRKGNHGTGADPVKQSRQSRHQAVQSPPSLEYLQSFHDTDFVRQAYRSILHREADAGGFDNYLSQLRSGRLSKLELLATLRYSEEGMRIRQEVPGLERTFRFRRLFRKFVPEFLLKRFEVVVRRPAISRNMKGDDGKTAALRHGNAEIESQLARLVFTKADRAATTRLREEIEAELAGKVERSDLTVLREEVEKLTSRKADAEEVASLSEQYRAALLQLHSHRSRIVELERKVCQLLDAVRSVCSVSSNGDQSQADPGGEIGLDDALYADLGNFFRGPREEIKSRMHVYLPYVARQAEQSQCKRVLDLGCGRGEWIELLGEHGYEAIGIEPNSVQAGQCRKLGLTVERIDAVDYLQVQKEGSFGTVSALHLVEHLPVQRLVSLVVEALRVLVSGGLLILETPNPGNLLVGSCNFYFDPTHLHPLPSKLLQYILENRGYLNVETLPLHPVTDFAAPPKEPLPQPLMDLVYGPMDYAVLAWKG
ncbi:MAG: methyltransferase domain-containing protein [Bryobacteraceae bacterium]